MILDQCFQSGMCRPLFSFFRDADPSFERASSRTMSLLWPLMFFSGVFLSHPAIKSIETHTNRALEKNYKNTFFLICVFFQFSRALGPCFFCCLCLWFARPFSKVLLWFARVSLMVCSCFFFWCLWFACAFTGVVFMVCSYFFSCFFVVCSWFFWFFKRFALAFSDILFVVCSSFCGLPFSFKKLVSWVCHVSVLTICDLHRYSLLGKRTSFSSLFLVLFLAPFWCQLLQPLGGTEDKCSIW